MKKGEIPWSFNHRTRAHEAFDSSSGSESEAKTENKTKINIPSDDTRLFEELDISSRHETVEYKPNPWSIARINAVTRATNKEPPGQAISEDIGRKLHLRAPKGRIVDAFKVQAERKPPRVPPPSKALKVAKHKSSRPRVSREDQVDTQGVEQGEYPQHTNSFVPAHVPQGKPSHAPTILLSSASQQAMRFQPHPCAPTPYRTPESMNDDILIAKEPTLQRRVAHISTPNKCVFSQSRRAVPFLSRSSPPLGPDCPINASYLRPEGYQSSPPRPSHRNVDPSRRLLSGASVNQPFAYVRRDIRIAGNQRLPAFSPLTAPRRQAKESPNTVPPAMVEEESSPMPQWLASTNNRSLDRPQALLELVEGQPSNPVRNDNNSMPAESMKRPHRSPSPHCVPKFTPKRNASRLSAAHAGRGVSAYDACDDDPDVNWSTIMKPEKKKSKRFKPGDMRSSGPFRLPAPGLGNTKGKSKGAIRAETKQDTQAKSRVITYLPPPPSPSLYTAAPHNKLPQVEEHDASDDDDDVLYPKFIPAAQPPQDIGPVSLLQADSDDVTLVGEMDEQVFAFDVGEVKARYPKIRKLAKESCPRSLA